LNKFKIFVPKISIIEFTNCLPINVINKITLISYEHPVKSLHGSSLSVNTKYDSAPEILLTGNDGIHGLKNAI